MQNFTVAQVARAAVLGSCWAGAGLLLPPASPTWTLSTLAPLYVLHPRLLAALQTHSSPALLAAIATMFHLQVSSSLAFTIKTLHIKTLYYAKQAPKHDK